MAKSVCRLCGNNLPKRTPMGFVHVSCARNQVAAGLGLYVIDWCEMCNSGGCPSDVDCPASFAN